jgi:hypothetical protein
MKEGTHAPAPARGAEEPEVPQVPPAPPGAPAAPGLPGIAVPQPRPATGRVGLPDDPAPARDKAGSGEWERSVPAWRPGREEWTTRSMASLLCSARLAERATAALTASQVETLLAALGDAVAYRRCGADSLGCLDCESVTEGRCPLHAQNLDRARAYGELALLLAARA